MPFTLPNKDRLPLVARLENAIKTSTFNSAQIRINIVRSGTGRYHAEVSMFEGHTSVALPITTNVKDSLLAAVDFLIERMNS